MPFNSTQYAFTDISVFIGGVDITGITSIEYTEKATKSPLYGKGRYPLAIQSGQVSVEGKIGLFQSELEALIDAGSGSLLNLVVDISITYGDPDSGYFFTDRLEGVQFTTSTKSIATGDLSMKVSVPFVALRVLNHVA